MSSWRAAQQLLERRCVVCHGCYDAPCQLALGTYAGLERGASKIEVYDGARLLAIAPTRLGIDARDVPGWRDKGFHSVLPDAAQRDPAQSLLLRMLELKQQVPLPVSAQLPDDLEIGLDRRQECPRTEEFAAFAQRHPTWGMPYALPGLSADEHALLVRWVEQGTPHEPAPPLEPGVAAAIDRWEWFLNQPSKKARLMARYLYEHLFLASLHFDQLGSGGFFRLVRARNPLGQPVDEIATRRPFEDPGPGLFYYRIVPREGIALEKTHMPYALNEARLARYRELFLDPEYQVHELPPYDLGTSANPFAAFEAIPVSSRYRFMLDEARFTIGGFIKGPVCRGQVALNVIEDRFWITFVSPDSPVIQEEAKLLARARVDLGLPAEQGSNNLLLTWQRYARRQQNFLRAKADYLAKLAKSPSLVSLEQVWDGDATNDNAALTVFRHFDSATVVKGLVGGEPKNAWVVGYALLERIHYLLVAGFDVFGNVGHQLHTRMYMDFLRMEAEHNFLLLLPKSRRRALVDAWYRGVGARVKDQVLDKLSRFDQETAIAYTTDRPERELYAQLQAYLAPVTRGELPLEHESDLELRAAVEPLAALTGRSAALLPETSFVEVSEAGAPRYFTLLRESAHTNVAELFREDERRVPDEDRLTVVRGLVGAYPNALFVVPRSALDDYVAKVGRLDGEQAYSELRARYGVRRTNPHFWQHSDRFQQAHAMREPVEGGLFDYNRLDGQ